MSGEKIRVVKRDARWCVFLPLAFPWPHAGAFDAYQSWQNAITAGVRDALEFMKR